MRAPSMAAMTFSSRSAGGTARIGPGDGGATGSLGSKKQKDAGSSTMLDVEDSGRVRLLTLNRPEALNAFSEALYDAAAEAFIDAAADPDVAVVVLTGTGRAFCAGTDLVEMGARNPGGGGVEPGVHGFPGMINQMDSSPKPFICAVNGPRPRSRGHHARIRRPGLHVVRGTAAMPVFQPRGGSRSCQQLHLPPAPGSPAGHVDPTQRRVDQRRRGPGDWAWCGRCAPPRN